ncbi:MAG: TonB family protein [Mariprofundales bacterium]|nr:TonB family protein [Mariprofundales bacterium]
MPSVSDDGNALSWLDYLAALLAHLLVIMLLVIGIHASPPSPPLLHHLSVQLISPQQLAKSRHKHHRINHRSRPKVAKKTPRHSAKKRPHRRTTTLPKVTQRHQAKPAMKVKPANKSKPLDFDPFAPVQSPSNTPNNHHRRASQPLASATTPPLHDIITKQELSRYLARIQRAVQNQWKVPAKSQHQLTDPEMDFSLNRDGSLIKARITHSSGDRAMDRSLLKAIRAAAPFDLPADHFDLFQNNHMIFHPLH